MTSNEKNRVSLRWANNFTLSKFSDLFAKRDLPWRRLQLIQEKNNIVPFLVPRAQASWNKQHVAYSQSEQTHIPKTRPWVWHYDDRTSFSMPVTIFYASFDHISAFVVCRKHSDCTGGFNVPPKRAVWKNTCKVLRDFEKCRLRFLTVLKDALVTYKCNNLVLPTHAKALKIHLEAREQEIKTQDSTKNKMLHFTTYLRSFLALSSIALRDKAASQATVPFDWTHSQCFRSTSTNPYKGVAVVMEGGGGEGRKRSYSIQFPSQ